MPDITHCPACSAAFKVSAEQLQLASGWVRCGRCGEVFEAHKHFSGNAAPVFADEPVEAVATDPAPSPFAQPMAASPDTAKGMDFNRWTAASAVLLLLLVWQAVLSQRHVLAAEEPALTSVLQAMCAPVACEVSWPQEPESVLIDNSSFNENPEGGYTVQLRLKNTQHHAVATPALELSLTDLQDQVILRRVFTRNELALRDSMPALRDARTTLNFDLDPQLKEHVSGYRALIFYP